MNITHTLKTIASVLLILSINVAFLIAQSNIKLPEPILARSEAGKFVPRLEKLRVLSEKKQWKEFRELESELFYETDINGIGLRNGKFGELTKEELAAGEWRLYYICKMGLPTVKEMWGMDYSTRRFDTAWVALSGVSLIPCDDKSFGIDDKKFRRIRAAWMASLLKNFRARNKEIEEKVVAVLPKLIREHSIKLLRENKEKYAKGGASGDWSLHFRDFSKFMDIADGITGILNSATHRICWEGGWEKSFIEFLFDSFADDTPTIDEFIKMAGYSNDPESESFWNNMHKRVERSLDITNDKTAYHAQKYLRRSGFNANKLSKLSWENFEKKKTAEKRQKEKWEKLRGSLEAEERQLWEEMQKDGIKYQKEYDAKKKTAKTSASDTLSVSPPPAAPTTAPAKP